MKLIHSTPIFDLVEEKKNDHTFVKILSPDWVNIIAVNKNEEILLIHQYRHGIQTMCWETPGGMIDDKEESIKAAQRELLEETGYASDEWSLLTSIHTNPAFMNNRCHFFVACNVFQKNKNLTLDAQEDIREVKFVKKEEVFSMINDGTITHGIVVTGLSRYFLKNKKEESLL